jgi:hypothetical protein
VDKPDCVQYVPTSGRAVCLIGHTPELDCASCAAYLPRRMGPREVWTDEERENYLELAERER